MSKTILRLTGITIAAAGLVGLTATAAGAHEASQIGGSYHLTIRDNDGERAAATLTCYPHGGSHPRPYEACAQLEAVGGNVTAMSEDPGPCTMMWDPVTVRSEGLWGNTYSTYEETFANQCVAVRETGGVLFDF
ncbi:SSI family serine proteinase inhibitor [Stackebrandtia nassauensis]|uniref:Proteinase inhibitor I16 subtilisin-type inhibitor n=1 Tax=Stackebrandtia nassauensis (strain DSM 44728 / CIP 108903 / NRRL B-16338 / NBRC 102104 / LLR-40K-21) TaxID=446470 RepID=D3QBC9_STANL|nr:SSI family serine proteinase inhibitor [Stackebrandtia nassauensis]ADD42811.1 proteinase inhibitor I16 subtilisin-type inhibitor [Stackebrandtia nassauensis DSM 44728]